PLLREGIVVPVRQTITVDAAMKIASLQETVTVSGQSPSVDVENTKVGARLDHETLTNVPTSRTIFGSTTVLPGMTMGRQDPGGLNAATSTGIVAHGASNYNLNYYGVTADTPQNYGKMYYMDFGSAEEISVDTAAMGAEVGGGGGANINIIPKSGGNQLKGEAVYSATGRERRKISCRICGTTRRAASIRSTRTTSCPRSGPSTGSSSRTGRPASRSRIRSRHRTRRRPRT